jgi:hypothetical protein
LFPQTHEPVKVFFSYAHEDEALRDKLEKHLGLLKRQRLIEAWHDRRIVAGGRWATEIDTHLDAAHLILLLISADFIASDYCYGVEFGRALERHEAGQAHIIPVLLSAADWESAPFASFNALPTNALPVKSWADADEAFADIARGIRAAVERMRPGAAPAAPAAPERRAAGDERRDGEAGRPDDGRFEVPALLPYLCDRSDQEGELGEAMSAHLKERPRRPFVLIVHGDEDECHTEFLERLQDESLPALLDLKRRRLPVQSFALPWPESLRAAGRTPETSKALRRLVAHTLAGTSAAPPERVFEEVAPECPVMLCLLLKTENLARGGLGALRAFFDFWDGWPDLPVGRTLLCAVSVRHQHVEGMGFFRRREMRKVDAEVRRFLGGGARAGAEAGAAAAALDFADYPGLGGVVLPELRSVTEQEVIVWSRSRPVRAKCRIKEAAIEALFRRRELCAPGGPIPMRQLAEELEALVKKHRL